MSADIEEPRGRRADGTVTLEGVLYQHIRYGEETIDGVRCYTTPCHICRVEPGGRHRPGCPMGPGFHRQPERCRDCRVELGETHHMICGIAQCPRCRGQYVTCACNGNEDAEDDDADWMFEGRDPGHCPLCNDPGTPMADNSQTAERDGGAQPAAMLECPAGHRWREHEDP